MADPATAALLLSATTTAAPAVATPFTMGLMGAAGTAATTAAPGVLGAMGAGAGGLGSMGAISANPLVTSLVNGGAAGSLISPAAAGTVATDIIPASGIFANPSLSALSGTPAYTGMAGAPPTFMQSAMSAGRNIQGLMNENPALTSVAKQAGGAMMQPPPPPQVLQAPPIQSGQFAPVDFMSLLSQKPQQMQRRTSLLG